MGVSIQGLTGGGVTTHYGICYDDSFTGAALQTAINVTNGLIASCEQDFSLMQGWFGGINIPFSYPLGVQVLNQTAGGAWQAPAPISQTFGSGSFVELMMANYLTVANLRAVLVCEVSEMFMMQLDNGWFVDHGEFEGPEEGSMGEGLSRFCGLQSQIINGFGPASPPPGFQVSLFWLNSARANIVDSAPDDAEPDQNTGCSTLFIWYLYSQLGFTIPQIIRAGASSLAGVYNNLTGSTGESAWNSFSGLVNLHYPQALNGVTSPISYHPVGDSVFPVSNLTTLTTPADITCGYSLEGTVAVDKPAMAEIYVQLASSSPQMVSVSPSTVLIAVGQTTARFTIQAAKQRLPFTPVAAILSASYANVTKSEPITVVSPVVTDVEPHNINVICGNSATATVTLNHASTDGAAPVIVTSGDESIVQVSIHPIPQGSAQAQLAIKTSNITAGFSPQVVTVAVALGGVTKTMTVTVVSPTVAKLTFTPSTLPLGGTGKGVVTLDRASYLGDVIVNLAANGFSFAYTPAQVTIPQGLAETNPPFTVTAPESLGPFEPPNVSIDAEYDGTTVSAELTFTPGTETGILAGFTISPNPVEGGLSTTGTVALESAVTTDTIVGIIASPTVRVQPGSTVTLPSATVPPQVRIKAGHISATFQVGTGRLPSTGSDHTVTISASAFVTKQVTLTLR